MLQRRGFNHRPWQDENGGDTYIYQSSNRKTEKEDRINFLSFPIRGQTMHLCTKVTHQIQKKHISLKVFCRKYDRASSKKISRVLENELVFYYFPHLQIFKATAGSRHYNFGPAGGKYFNLSKCLSSPRV